MEFDELKEKYTELRKRYLDLQNSFIKQSTSWHLFLFAEKDSLRSKNEKLSAENAILNRELRTLKERIDNNVSNDLQLHLKEKEEQFNSVFPPIE